MNLETPDSVESTFKTGISVPRELHAKAMVQARWRFQGKFSRYVQALIEADVARDAFRRSAMAKLTAEERAVLMLPPEVPVEEAS